jgi:hypothetical protein
MPLDACLSMMVDVSFFHTFSLTDIDILVICATGCFCGALGHVLNAG